jgi:exopolysaccharide biosynthesis polyprenyl glycosylphosphotransferase
VVFGMGVAAGVLSKKRRDLLFPVLFLASDSVMVVGAFLAAFWIRVGPLNRFLAPFSDPFSHSLPQYLGILRWIMIIWLGTFSFMGLYRRVRSVTRFTEFTLIFKTVSLGALLIMAGSYLWKYDFSRPVMILFWGLTILFMVISRSAIRALQSAMLRKGYNVIRALVVGCTGTGSMVLKKVAGHPELGYKVVGFVDIEDSARTEFEGRPVFGGVADILSVIERERVDEVFIAEPEMSHPDILDLIVHCDKARVSFRIVSDLFDIVTRPVDLDDVADIPVVDLGPGGGGWLGNAACRMIDLMLGGLMLLIFSPIWLLIALLLWLERTTPVVEREERVGRGREHFMMYRFRTVKTPGAGSAAEERRSAFGRLLWRSGLDESLQLLNVLRGEMSLVGPRPEIPAIAGQYEEWQNKRFDVRPGITGLWQIAGHQDLPIHRNLEYDFYYIKNRSLMLDLSILFRTALGMLLGQPWRKKG